MLCVLLTRLLRHVILCGVALPYIVRARSVNLRSTAPAPLSIPPSQEFDGDDGPWSTFTIQIGSPPQSVKVLISTYATQTWAIAEEGCGSGDPTDCDTLRGGLYNYSASTTWVPNLANLTTQIYGLGLESNLGYSGNGRYGFDDITLGFQGSGGPTLKNQTVAGVATKDFFMGIFGLKPLSSNFTSFNDPIPSFMQNLKNQSMIPSTSWAYTAGNQYHSSEVLGSLTLGGYDASRFIPNNLSFNFSTNDQPDLAVQVTSITSLNSSSNDPTILLSTPIITYLDSTVPYLYLPLSTCDLVASTFGLTYNTTTQLYTISNTQHTLLVAQNPTINFTLTRPDSLGSPINLVFSYQAFALQATWPLVDTPTLYFPMKIANDSSQYRLGRAFFQETYVIADYERRNFSISQVRYDIPTQEIITIYPPGNTTSLSTSTKKSVLATGAIAGIAIGGAILLISLILLLFYVCHYKPKTLAKRRASELSAAQQPTSQPTEYTKPELDTISPILHEVPPDNFPAQEIDSKSKQVFFELPAKEEVAAEVSGSTNLSSVLLREQEEMRIRREGEVRWSWDRRRRASRGEKSVGTESEDLSSGWGDREEERTVWSLGTTLRGASEHEHEDEKGKGYVPDMELQDVVLNRDGEERDDDEGDAGASSVSSGWVSSPKSAFSGLR
ncbi:acid protease [Mollisia scopiformis]|uniref:Acid protease n=1 Tax=Mollisia scopiformis TaxID=149040 RepID=A0A194WUP4_MOLSC|nr:acid protease [Mollisia scopiformis]KUJ11683.1 acid protease [Mollisia scopiformis]